MSKKRENSRPLLLLCGDEAGRKKRREEEESTVEIEEVAPGRQSTPEKAVVHEAAEEPSLRGGELVISTEKSSESSIPRSPLAPQEEVSTVELEEQQEPQPPLQREATPAGDPYSLENQLRFNPHDYFELQLVNSQRWKKAPLAVFRYTIAITKELPTTDLFSRQLQMLEILRAAFENILAKAPQGVTAQMFATNPYFHKMYVASRRGPADQFRFDDIVDRICAILNSDESVPLDSLKLCLTLYSPHGITIGMHLPPGINRRKYMDINEWARNCRALEDPMGADNKIPPEMQAMCLCLALAKELKVLAECELNPNEGYAKVRNRLAIYGKTLACKEEACKIALQANVTPCYGPFSLDQLEVMVRALTVPVKVEVFTSAAPPLAIYSSQSVIENTHPPSGVIRLFLAYNGQESTEATDFHAYIMRADKVHVFMGTRDFCLTCYKGKSRDGRHFCPEACCKLCRFLECKNTDNDRAGKVRICCENCLNWFLTEECLKAHEMDCESMTHCPICRALVGKEWAEHECSDPYCSTCMVKHPPFDPCYVPVPAAPLKTKRFSIFYGDIESQVDPTTNEHTPNLLVLQRSTDRKEYVYKTDGSGEALTKYIADCIRDDSPFKKSYHVFHNMAGYDGVLIYNALCKAKFAPKSVIKRGQKLLTLEMPRNQILLRDSLLFIPGTPLAGLARMFGLKDGVKGDFPHKLNTPQWVQFGNFIPYREVDEDGTVHRFPKLDYFCLESKSPAEAARIREHHAAEVARYAKHPNLVYFPEDELIKYCKQDVKILLLGFEAYRKAWLDQFPTMEPLESITFPALNNRLFREKYMQPNSICLLPPQGFERKNQPQSVLALAWLSWTEIELELSEFRCSRKGFEVTISGFRVDGTGVDSQGIRYVLEFHGCYFHACPECYPERTPELETAHQWTLQRDAHLRWVSAQSIQNSPYGPFQYIAVRECGVLAESKRNPKLGQYIDEYRRRHKEADGPLSLRDALRGGRTNAIMHVLNPIPEGKRLYYLDFTSLYPAVMFGVNLEEWPVGMPQIFIGVELDSFNAPTPDNWFGFAKVTILPPRNLLHPVLGQVVKDRLLFHLCTACAALAMDSKEAAEYSGCQHQPSERAIKGTFFTKELDLALKWGYQLLAIHEVWNWPLGQRSRTLFKEMIKDQYSKKALASGRPKSEAEFDNLIEQYKEKMDLNLRKSDFVENKALRALAKFSLNNIWGFLGKRNNMESMEFVNSFDRFLELDNDPNAEITMLDISADDETLMVAWKPLTESPGQKGSVALAAAVTSYARIALYNIIARYPKEVVYFDTDSVFLLLDQDQAPPETSDMLGDLKDEIAGYGPGARVASFCSLGPKAYSFVVTNDKNETLAEICRLKGIHFNESNSRILTRDVLQTIPTNPERVLHVSQFLIRKSVMDNKVWSSHIVKKVQFLSRKRFIPAKDNPHLNSIPYGYDIES